MTHRQLAVSTQDTHKVEVSVLRNLPVVREDIFGLDVVAGLLLGLVVVVVLLLLGCLVGVLLIKIIHKGWTDGLLGGGVPCEGEEAGLRRLTGQSYIFRLKHCW